MAATMNSNNTMIIAAEANPIWNDLMGNTADSDSDSDSDSYPNWKDLPPELLSAILKFLRVVDNIAFGAVCTDWYSVAARNLHLPALQPPFLLLAGGDTVDRDIFQFFDLSSQKFYKIRLPQLCNLRCIGSSDGKLIYIDNRAELHVLDPITGSHFDLPSITTFPDVGEPQLDAEGNLTGYLYEQYHAKAYSYRHKELDYFIKGYFLKAIICPRTSAIVVIRTLKRHLAFCLSGDQAWTVIENIPPMHDVLMHSFMDVVLYKDCLYVITYCGVFISFQISDDFKDTKVEVLIPRVNLGIESTRYLVEMDGELLQVCRMVDTVDRDPKDTDDNGEYWPDFVSQDFYVYKMNWGTMDWDPLESIGEYALFLGLNNSFSLSTRDFPELKANSIYFTDGDMLHVVICPQLKRDLGVFNLEDWTVESCYPSEDDRLLTWPPPIWFTPKTSCRRWKTET